MKLSGKLLLKNVSAGRMAAFVLSNVMGLLIVAGAIQFYTDARGIWEDEDGFMSADYLVVNKQVTGSTLYNPGESEFSEAEISDLERQPWVRSVGRFKTASFRVGGSLTHGGAGMSSALFLESVPDRYLDVSARDWRYTPGQQMVPLIIPKDYLTLYNFGFATSAGMPRMSEQLMEGVPLQLRLRGDDGNSIEIPGRVVGFTNRLNTILVPESFMDMANSLLSGDDAAKAPTRLIIDTNSPGDTAITSYLKEHGWEQAGGEGRNSAAFLLKVAAGIAGAIGVAITLMSLMILLLSISLLMEKNRQKIRSLLLLGTPLGEVSGPYRYIAAAGAWGAWVVASCGIMALRQVYLPSLRGLGGEEGAWWAGILSAALLACLVTVANILTIDRRVKKSWKGV